MPEERFSDLAVIVTYYSERFEVEVDEICQQAFLKAHPRRIFNFKLVCLSLVYPPFSSNNYCCCTVLLVGP